MWKIAQHFFLQYSIISNQNFTEKKTFQKQKWVFACFLFSFTHRNLKITVIYKYTLNVIPDKKINLRISTVLLSTFSSRNLYGIYSMQHRLSNYIPFRYYIADYQDSHWNEKILAWYILNVPHYDKRRDRNRADSNIKISKWLKKKIPSHQSTYKDYNTFPGTKLCIQPILEKVVLPTRKSQFTAWKVLLILHCFAF